MTLRAAFALVGSATAAILGGCGGLLGSGAPEVRYKVALEVEDGGRLVTGSSVWSWTLSKPTVGLASPYSGKFQGEAVAIELSGGRTLFAVLRGADGNEGAMPMLPERLFGDIGRDARGEPKQFPSDRVADLRDIASRQGERRILDCESQPNWCPMLVTFGDTSDPTSVRQVDPLAVERSLGEATALRRIVVEIVDEPVTRGIETKLPWLASVGRERATLIPNPPRYLSEATPIQLLAPSAFSTELYK